MSINAGDVSRKLNNRKIKHCDTDKCVCEIDSLQRPESILTTSFHLKGTKCNRGSWYKISQLIGFLQGLQDQGYLEDDGRELLNWLRDVADKLIDELGV